MDKEDMVHIYKGILLTIENNERKWNNAICNDIDGPRDYHTEWSNSERERWILYNSTFM